MPPSPATPTGISRRAASEPVVEMLPDAALTVTAEPFAPPLTGASRGAAEAPGPPFTELSLRGVPE